MSDSDLRAKYGAGACDAGHKIQPQTFARRLVQRDSLDQNFTQLWLDFAISGMSRRPALDTRTRLLVLVGQYTMAKSHAALEDTVRAALAAGVKPREILEIILQCVVYGGHTTVEPAIEVFHRLAEELGLLEELRASQLPRDGNDRARSYDKERLTWHPDDVADSRCAGLMQRHGWLAIGRGLTMRPRHHLNVLAWLDTMDPEFAGLWVKFCYQGMYSRGIVDDKTRLLCMVGDCLAVGEATQARGHMRGAMRNGASPREVMEVILQTCVNFGMPPMLHALESFVEIMAEDGRLAEIGNPPRRVETYSK
ncbi:MAG: carboxymuconolactone decarboxylase family protein [Betaproteobacteria bacterium]|nr:carboxymuconolactone decarboxylase family protein [Betaproteobacteria bacterium]MBI2289264.1 carboxymuconolactone decarboxylase family protein [Betaproteobacteria bacterium]